MQLDANTEKTDLKIGVVRGILSDVANKVFASWIFLTLPIYLARSGSHNDFVKDAFAITFITSMDDDTVAKNMAKKIQGRMEDKHEALVSKKMLDEAIAVFALNVESYPNSANTHDSLGEAYMKAGQKAQAIESYEKSLELNPGNDNAVAMLKILRGGYRPM